MIQLRYKQYTHQSTKTLQFKDSYYGEWKDVPIVLFNEDETLLEDPKPCKLPPIGWSCTRTAGHTGPCAAIENPVSTPVITPAPLYMYHCPKCRYSMFATEKGQCTFTFFGVRCDGITEKIE